MAKLADTVCRNKCFNYGHTDTNIINRLPENPNKHFSGSLPAVQTANKIKRILFPICASSSPNLFQAADHIGRTYPVVKLFGVQEAGFHGFFAQGSTVFVGGFGDFGSVFVADFGVQRGNQHQ